jgi:hypothetical protein
MLLSLEDEGGEQNNNNNNNKHCGSYEIPKSTGILKLRNAIYSAKFTAER